jgi:hypothetical protein
LTDVLQKTKLASPHPVQETFDKIKVAAKDVSMAVKRMNSSLVIHLTNIWFQFLQ